MPGVQDAPWYGGCEAVPPQRALHERAPADACYFELLRLQTYAATALTCASLRELPPFGGMTE